MQGSNLLLIRPGALGDAILTLPVLHALRLAGAARITVLGTPANWGFLRAAREPLPDGRRTDCVLEICDFSSAEWLGLFSTGAQFSARAREILQRTSTALVYLLDDDHCVENALRASGV